MNFTEILIYLSILAVLGICFYYWISNNDDFQLKCIVSSVDGNKYCVRDRKKIQESVDLLARATENCKKLVEYVKNKYPDDENVRRLVTGFNPQKINETLPTSVHTAYSENKGEKIAFCLNKKKNKDLDDLIDEHTLTFVAIHELSHVMTKSIGHKSDFWENFRFLLDNAKEAGIHEPVDYSKKPKEFCSMSINDSPYYNL
jgi:predicted metal-dependent hydrolase